MYCINCGMELPDTAKFCLNFGVPIGTSSSAYDALSGQNTSSTKLVPAKCTNCNAALNIDPNQDAAVCPYCGMPYIVEKAISNYDISVSGNVHVGTATINIADVNVDNLLKRAEQFERPGDFDSSLDYYNRVLDSDATNTTALEEVRRVNDLIRAHVYYSSEVNLGGWSRGELMLKRGELEFYGKRR